MSAGQCGRENKQFSIVEDTANTVVTKTGVCVSTLFYV